MKSRTTAALAATLLIGACSRSLATEVRPDGVLAALADPQAVELVALHPYPYQLEEADERPRFHGYGVLGRAPLDDGGDRNRVLALVERGIEASNGMVAACFSPRHGLRVEADGSRWDLVVCFECLSMKVYRDGEQVDGHLTSEVVEPQVTALFEASGLAIHGD
ncbi:MAG: hypothetical protein AAF682_14405 [Planctomycetota bacterium]